MGKKITVALMVSLFLAVGGFGFWVRQKYGSFETIPHYDVTMWIFWAALLILILMALLVIIVLYAVSARDQEAPLEDGSYIESNDELQEAPTEEAVETPVEEQTEEEAELEIEAPELSEMISEAPVEEAAEEEAVADLEELAAINSKRPYFLLVHVREYSNVKRVKSILDKLGPEFELVPLDIFLKMAGHTPTFQERFLKK